MNNINANTALYCIFGNPVRHSLSPVMQNAAFKASMIDAVYLAFEVKNIENALLAMKSLNIRGASVTIPFKIDVIDHLDEVDSLALEIGSVNTLHNVNGRIIGYNTDGYGAVDALINNNIQIKDSNILIIGNGGSARAIAFTLIMQGANIFIAGRNAERMKPLVHDLRKKKPEIEYCLIKDITLDFIKQIDIIINTTSVGMTPNIDNTPIDTDLIYSRHTIFDIVYSPNMTKLLLAGSDKNCKIVRGIEMLINQGARQFEIWTGKKAQISVMEDVLRKYI
ncbi:MAG: shikimate dehydrogenase [Spirochaetota bacterium]|nr:shikimate dehydrogenase [Spirochaetota bacterium]